MNNQYNALYNVLIIGSGGREHAIAWKINQSRLLGKLYCAPGNGGIAEIAQCIPINAMDFEGIKQFVTENHIDLVVVAPDDPLAAGLVDFLEESGIKAFGPRKIAAQIESSKVFSKMLMKKYNIPSATYEKFSSSCDALYYLNNKDLIYPVVIKADGLARGKGVIIAENYGEASNAIHEIMEEKIFGSSGNSIIIEEYLRGQEITVLAFTDGTTIKPMVSSQDHKRVYDNDLGPNTGGMGAFSPSLIYNDEVEKECIEKIIDPTMVALALEGIKFKGVLYFGLMLTDEGLKVIEYNARFGDPEAQVVLPRLKTDLLEIILSITEENLNRIEIEWDNGAAVCIIAASGGYPGKYKNGYPIKGLDEIQKDEGVYIFHAGTRCENGKKVTAGGRVIGITSTGKNFEQALSKAYESISKIYFEGMHYRKDIGRK